MKGEAARNADDGTNTQTGAETSLSIDRIGQFSEHFNIQVQQARVPCRGRICIIK